MPNLLTITDGFGDKLQLHEMSDQIFIQILAKDGVMTKTLIGIITPDRMGV